MNYEKALEYHKSGILSKRDKTIGSDLYEIFCYTQNTFHEGNWDEITLSHRGLIYKNSVPVNKPFPKIFNLGEHESSSLKRVLELTEKYKYHVMDKANGHLLIVSFVKGICPILSTKGSMDSELIDQDIELALSNQFYSYVNDNRLFYEGNTMMFEVIAEHDPHTMYKYQKELYGGEDTFVLIGGYNADGTPYDIYDLEAVTVSQPCMKMVKVYDDMKIDNINEWFSHKDIEGYVLWFPEIDFRVKIKCDEYWKLRFAKEFTFNKIIDMFESGGRHRLYNKLPEELYALIEEIEKSVVEWYHHVRNTIPEHILNSTDKKYVNTTNEIDSTQKWIYNSSVSVALQRVMEFETSRKIFVRSKWFQQWKEESRDHWDSILMDFIEKQRGI